jgi:hypothetical protein
MLADYTQGMRPDGRELLVVVVKGTFAIPPEGETACLAPEQLPLVEADAFAGEPGLSSPTLESDFAPFKPRCDVLLNACAYAPGGEPTRKLVVSLRVGGLTKDFRVVGDRVWQKRWFLTWLRGLKPTRPQPFTVMPLSYEVAFGGSDCHPKQPKHHRVFEENPLGRGFSHKAPTKVIKGTPLPNTEPVGEPLKKPRTRQRPMGFGPIGRSWMPRRSKAGTYDEGWLENTFPFLPADFDDAYHQAAPADQQCDYLKGGEKVVLLNLTPQGRTSFTLPTLAVPVVFFLRDGTQVEAQAVLDTLHLDPGQGLLTLAWRASLPLRQNIFEVNEVLTGTMPKGWWRARKLGKTWHPSLASLAASRASEREPETAQVTP